MADTQIPKILTMAEQKVDEGTYHELVKDLENAKINFAEWPKSDKGAEAPPVVNLDELPADKQAEIKQAMEDVKDTVDKPDITPLPKTCKNCGFDPDKDPVEVTEMDKEEFVRSILAQRPFTKTFAMFGGRMKITFRIRTMQENDLIAEQCSLEINDGRIPTTSLGLASQVYHIRLRRLQMAVSIARIEPTSPVEFPAVASEEGRKRYAPQYIEDEGKKKLFNNCVGVAHDKIFSDWPEPVFAMAYKLYAQFEQTYVRLMEQSLNSDFWKEVVG
jgi:hypothetical protein